MKHCLGILLAIALATEHANCQASKPVTVIVAVIRGDSSRLAVPDADLVILQGLTGVLGRTKSDSSGFARMTIRPAGSTIQLSVRRIGFAPIARFIQMSSADTVVTHITLTPLVQSLAAVSVRAAHDPTLKSYYIDADAIEASGKQVYSALDIMTRLRPDMVTSRAPEACADSSGPRPGQRTRHPPTGGISNVWVNGVRIRLSEGSGWVRVPNMKEAFVRKEVIEVLEEIRPEHIADIKYTDCFDTSVPVNGGQSAVFIRLKDGVAYEHGRGSFVEGKGEPKRPPA